MTDEERMFIPTSERLRAALRSQCDGWHALGAPAGAWLIPEFILSNGIDCAAQALPDGFIQGQPRKCFENSARLVAHVKDLIYCEGFVTTPRAPFPIHHAWAIDLDRNVIDLTLEEPQLCAYVGVTINWLEYAAHNEITGSVSMLALPNDTVNVGWILRRAPALRQLVERART